MVHLTCSFLHLGLTVSSTSNEAHAITVCLNVSTIWHKMSDSLLGL